MFSMFKKSSTAEQEVILPSLNEEQLAQVAGGYDCSHKNDDDDEEKKKWQWNHMHHHKHHKHHKMWKKTASSSHPTKWNSWSEPTKW